MDTHTSHMQRAIELAKRGVEAGDGGPFGAVVVCAGEVIGEGWNQVVCCSDPTAHGEIVAIREASKQLGRFDLSGCDLYTTGEPCPMCLGAIYWSRIERVFYGFSLEQAHEIGFDDQWIYEQFTLPRDKRKIKQTQVMAKEAMKLARTYLANPQRVRY